MEPTTPAPAMDVTPPGGCVPPPEPAQEPWKALEPATGEPTATAAEAEQVLSDVIIAQLSFKPDMMREIAITILVTMLKDRIRWADEFDFSFVPDKSRNTIGATWKRLLKLGLVERLAQWRSSKKKAANGRTVWKYHLKSIKLAETFLERNGRAVRKDGQPELFGTLNPAPKNS